MDEDLKRDPEGQDRQFTQLMDQVKELKEENIQLRNRLNEKDTQDKENKVCYLFGTRQTHFESSKSNSNYN